MRSVLNINTQDSQLIERARWIESQPEERKLALGCQRVTMFYYYYLPDKPSLLAPVFVEELLDELLTLAVVRKRVAHWKTLDAPLKDVLMGVGAGMPDYRTADYLAYNFNHPVVGRYRAGLAPTVKRAKAKPTKLLLN